MKKNIKISSNRSFGIVFFVFFLIVSIWPLFYDENIRLWSLVIALIFLFLGLIKSNILSPLNYLWSQLGIFLGNFIAPIVMGLIFFLVVTPIGLIMRILNKDLLELKKSNLKNTYWKNKEKYNSSMRNQF